MVLVKNLHENGRIQKFARLIFILLGNRCRQFAPDMLYKPFASIAEHKPKVQISKRETNTARKTRGDDCPNSGAL